MEFVKPGRVMVFLVCLVFLAAFGAAVAGAQEAMKVSGKLTLAYTQQDSIVVGDESGHVMVLDASKGKNENTGENAFMDGAQATNMSYIDMTLGNGENQGYVVFVMGDNAVYAKWNGTLTTVLGDEDQPEVGFEGEYIYIMGTGQFENISGGGKYSGYFISDTEYVCEWQGEYKLGK